MPLCCLVATAAAPGSTSAATAAVGLALPPSHGGYRVPKLVHIELKGVKASTTDKEATIPLRHRSPAAAPQHAEVKQTQPFVLGLCSPQWGGVS
jgi:hypothetical protein